jgi:predicted GNAT family N-acyltransferase
VADVRLDSVTSADWAQVVGAEKNPWGTLGEELEWGDKDQHVTIRDEHGQVRGMAGSLIARVRVRGGGHEPIDVLGVGGVFVRASDRGQGLAGELLERLLEAGRERGPHWAMLFCDEPLTALYGKHGFVRIEAPVWAEQKDGPVEMPMAAMYLPLASGLSWPPGQVDVLGHPF